MFLKCGCGCIVLPIHSEGWRREAWTVRMVECCYGDAAVTLGSEFRLDSRMTSDAIAKAVFIDREETTKILNRWADLISKGFEAEELKRTLRRFLREDQSGSLL